jgi:hypothetical protein
MVAAGAKWLRTDIDWWLVQPQRDVFDWSLVDRVVNAASARGLQIVGMIGYTPPWARPSHPGPDDKFPPDNPQDYANFATAASARYVAAVNVWEVWNEPNISAFWEPAPNVAAYTTLLQAAYPAIKAGNPNAAVITAGTSPANDGFGTDVNPVTFLNGIYENGGGDSFDAVTHHPSTYPDLCTSPWAGGDWRNNSCSGVVPELRQAILDHGQDKQVWATEMGAPAPWQSMTVEFLADYIRDAYGWWRQQDYTGPLIWYTYRDHGTDPTDIDDNSGVTYHDFSPKDPALTAITEALHK